MKDSFSFDEKRTPGVFAYCEGNEKHSWHRLFFHNRNAITIAPLMHLGTYIYNMAQFSNGSAFLGKVVFKVTAVNVFVCDVLCKYYIDNPKLRSALSF